MQGAGGSICSLLRYVRRAFGELPILARYQIAQIQVKILYVCSVFDGFKRSREE